MPETSSGSPMPTPHLPPRPGPLINVFVSGGFVNFKLTPMPAGCSKFSLKTPGGQTKTRGFSSIFWGRLTILFNIVNN